MAQIQADEISRLLREEIENYEKAVNVAETGSSLGLLLLGHATADVATREIALTDAEIKEAAEKAAEPKKASRQSKTTPAA